MNNSILNSNSFKQKCIKSLAKKFSNLWMVSKVNAVVCIFFMLFSICVFGQSKQVKINYVSTLQNTNHEQVAYWFFSKTQLQPSTYKSKIDSLAAFSKYTLIFLTARNDVDFYDDKTMHPIFKEVVKYAHSKGLKIGLQLWDVENKVPIENTERIIQEGEMLLDENGKASYTVAAKHVRNKTLLLKSELLKVYVFKKTGDGFYDKSSLLDITQKVKKTENKENVTVTIDAGAAMKGYTIYILTQHYYNYWSNHSVAAVSNITNIIKLYADIPFDGAGLDEYTSLPLCATWELQKGDTIRERTYSLAMAEVLKKNTGKNLVQTLFEMRYVPNGKAAVRMSAINNYMALMRSGTIEIEKEIYRAGKLYFGANTFIGLHDTYHNGLEGDEIWQTGLNWWNIKRDYGHTDEHTPTATQMGIGMSYPMNVMYNMYYHKILDKIWTKALTDLRFGIRTDYHAINDVQSWGVSIEEPRAMDAINKVENCARLLNRFNPSFPKVKLLVLFGMEAQANWYPDRTARNMHDINGTLNIENKAVQLWDAGYLNALVPTDLIADGRLKIGANGKPLLQGHEFDAVVFLYPQYAKKSTIQFLQKYVSKGGKLITEGSCTNDFNGNDITATWKNIANKTVATSFSVEAVSRLGINKNEHVDGILNEDGSYTFTDTSSLKTGVAAAFNFTKNGNTFSGNYKGLAVIKVNENGAVEKFSAAGFSSLKKNEAIILSTDKATDIFIEAKNNTVDIIIVDETKSIKIINCKI
jgi:hypothetical protein